MADIAEITGFTKKWEGGLSRAKTDTASSYPSPYTHKGYSDWHTNKGVTYRTFEDSSKRLGFQNTADNFLNMPENIWLKIAKEQYWDKLGLDKVKSQAVANLMFSWQWGSGYAWTPRLSSYLKSKGINWSGGSWQGKTLKLSSDFKQIPDKLNELTDKIGEKQAFDELAEQKKQFLLGLGQPQNEKGWMNRLNDLKNYSYKFIGTGYGIAKKHPILTISITAVLLISTYIVIKSLTQKNK